MTRQLQIRRPHSNDYTDFKYDGLSDNYDDQTTPKISIYNPYPTLLYNNNPRPARIPSRNPFALFSDGVLAEGECWDIGITLLYFLLCTCRPRSKHRHSLLYSTLLPFIQRQSTTTIQVSFYILTVLMLTIYLSVYALYRRNKILKWILGIYLLSELGVSLWIYLTPSVHCESQVAKMVELCMFTIHG